MTTHPTAERLERYRRRAGSAAELLEVDAHVASCDHCFALLGVREDAIVLPPATGRTHLTYDEMEALVDGRTERVERELAETHLADCATCRGEVADLTAMREAMRGRPMPVRKSRTRWLAAAAVIAAIVLAVWWLRRTHPPTQPLPQRAHTVPSVPPPSPPPRTIDIPLLARPAIAATLWRPEHVLRSAPGARAFALQAPVGTVVADPRPRLRWTAVNGAANYEVAIVDAERGGIAAMGSTAQTGWWPERPLERGRTYSWQVTAHVGDEAVVAPGTSGPEALFHVATAATIAEIEAAATHGPLAHGLALAQHGLLDDAERELQAAVDAREAGAAEALARVRSWRQRASPTTTNAAQ